MALIKPFKALRPLNDKVEFITVQHDESIKVNRSSRESASDPDGSGQMSHKSYKNYSRESHDVIEQLSDRLVFLAELKRKGLMVKDSKSAFYIYRLKKGSETFVSIIAAASVEDYLRNRILKHENILTENMKGILNHIEILGTMENPALLTYPDNNEINHIVNKYIKSRVPEYSFTSFDHLVHTLWMMTETNEIELIKKEFAGMRSLYIADGHHRIAGVAEYNERLRKEGVSSKMEDSYNFFPACFVPFSNVHVYGYHRLVKDDMIVYNSEFMTKISELFEISLANNFPVIPDKKGVIGIYFNHHSYLLKLKPVFKKNLDGILENMDVCIAEKFILHRIFRITDPKSDKKLTFIDGSKDLGDVQKTVDSGEQSIVITLFPITIKEVRDVADNQLIMPPKSTWVEPKIHPGLVIYEVE